jgi:putative hydrolase of the HAD superfamily
VVSVVIVDVDGVLRLWDPRSIPDTAARHGLPPGSLEEAAFADPWLKQAVTGALDHASWRDSIATRLAGAHRIPGDRASAAVAQWSATPGTIDTQVLELMREQRRLTRVVLLSNATDRLEEDLERLGVLHEVDEVYNSSRLGLAKPDPELFAAVAGDEGVEAHECAFVDDTLEHVSAAASLGMLAHHYTTVDRLTRFLARLR